VQTTTGTPATITFSPEPQQPYRLVSISFAMGG
jgi:hypothetical protein